MIADTASTTGIKPQGLYAIAAKKMINSIWVVAKFWRDVKTNKPFLNK